MESASIHLLPSAPYLDIVLLRQMCNIIDQESHTNFWCFNLSCQEMRDRARIYIVQDLD